jgi:hypothetical protein
VEYGKKLFLDDPPYRLSPLVTRPRNRLYPKCFAGLLSRFAWAVDHVAQDVPYDRRSSFLDARGREIDFTRANVEVSGHVELWERLDRSGT